MLMYRILVKLKKKSMLKYVVNKFLSTYVYVSKIWKIIFNKYFYVNKSNNFEKVFVRLSLTFRNKNWWKHCLLLEMFPV